LVSMKQKLYSLYLKCTAPMKTVAGAALLLAVFGIASRILGLIRDRILASRFGAGDILDVYYASFRVPDLIYSLLVLGALSAAFIPVFTEVRKKISQEKAWDLSNGILFLLVSSVAVISLGAILLMPFIIQIIAPGFSGEKQEMAVLFTRIMFLSPIFLGVSAIFGGVLVSKRCFWAYSLAPLFYNLGIILGAVFFVGYLGPIGLAWGVAFGALLHLIIQFAAVRKMAYKPRLRWKGIWKDAYIRRIIRLMLPRTLTVAANQINLFVVTIFASTLAAGSLAVFNFANNLQSIPLALFGISFAVAAFPKLSSLATSKKKKEFIHTFARTMRRVLFFVIPASVLLLVLRAQVVRVVLGSGNFDWQDTVDTFQVLGLLAFSLFAQSLLPLLARTFYSLQNTKIPFYTTLASEVVNILLVILLIGKYGVFGLAFAFSVASIVNVSLLLYFLKKKLGSFENGKTRDSLLKILIASILAGLGAQIMKTFWGEVTDLSTFIEVFVQLVTAGITGIAVFFAASYYLKIEEFHDFKEKLIIRIFGQPKTLSEPEQKDIDRM